MDNFWDQRFLNNALKDWAIALGVIAGAIFMLWLLKSVVLLRVQKFTARTKGTFDDFILRVLQRSVMPLLYLLGVYFGLQYLVLSPRIAAVMHVAVLFAVTFFLLRAVSSFIAYVFRQALLKQEHSDLRQRQSRGILLIIQAVAWLCGILFLIDNLGYDVTTLVAGLGIGGIAIALAAQAILGDLFSYLVIFFDRPFDVGDFIVLDDKMGTIEYVGIKTTRIRTLSGEQLICSNTDLTNSRVHNYKRMEERRIAFAFGVEYDTSAGDLEKLSSTVRQIIESVEGTRFDRAHFKSFGAYSLDFEVVYYVLSPDFNVYMDKQQQINLALVKAFQSAGIAFAFPTQTILLQKNGGTANAAASVHT